MTVVNVCLICGGMHDYEGCGCPMAASNSQWKRPSLSMRDAMALTVGEGDLVIGDPTSFKSDGIDMGWDLESGGYTESRQLSGSLTEYESGWQNREVVHPQTGFRVKVGSLPPEIQQRFQPDGFGIKGKVKETEGGVVVNQTMTVTEYQKKIHNMGSQFDIHHKETNSIYSLLKDLNGYTHVFWKIYDPEEFQFGGTQIARANKIVYVGVFKDFKYAKDYVTDMDRDLAQRLNHKPMVMAQGVERYGGT